MTAKECGISFQVAKMFKIDCGNGDPTNSIIKPIRVKNDDCFL